MFFLSLFPFLHISYYISYNNLFSTNVFLKEEKMFYIMVYYTVYRLRLGQSSEIVFES